MQALEAAAAQLGSLQNTQPRAHNQHLQLLQSEQLPVSRPLTAAPSAILPKVTQRCAWQLFGRDRPAHVTHLWGAPPPLSSVCFLLRFFPACCRTSHI
jgi:hypothetical protein